MRMDKFSSSMTMILFIRFTVDDYPPFFPVHLIQAKKLKSVFVSLTELSVLYFLSRKQKIFKMRIFDFDWRNP